MIYFMKDAVYLVVVFFKQQEEQNRSQCYALNSLHLNSPITMKDFLPGTLQHYLERANSLSGGSRAFHSGRQKTISPHSLASSGKLNTFPSQHIIFC